MSFKEDYNKKKWIYSGVGWGVFMFFISEIIFPFFMKEPITSRSIYVGIPLWILGGLGYGYWMKKYMERRNKNQEEMDD